MTKSRVGFSRFVIGMLALGLIIASIKQVATAFAPANDAFQRTWTRTDKPVADLAVSRTWMWGADAFTHELQERYAEAPGGFRAVQYFDKSRMEINHDSAIPAESPWHVTNGLLVVELVTGRMQVGDNSFEPKSPALVNVAGDPDDTAGPTYATFASVLDASPLSDGATIANRINRAGAITYDASLANYGVTAAHRVDVLGISHQVASPFWEFMNSRGLIHEDGKTIEGDLFTSPFYATGYPIAEAYWTAVKVDGDLTDVLIQCFERRCLTYTPSNPHGWKVEAGNVGRHYHVWRYGNVEEPTPSSTRSATPTVTPSRTPTLGPTGTPTPTNTSTIPDDPEYQLSFTWNDVRSPSAIDVDDNGRLYVVDGFSDDLYVYDPMGRLLLELRDYEYNWDELTDVSVLHLEGSVYVYLLASIDARSVVLIFSPDGDWLGGWTLDDSNAPSASTSLTVDSFGYVTVAGIERVSWYTWDGQPVSHVDYPDLFFYYVDLNEVTGEIYLTTTTQGILRTDYLGSIIDSNPDIGPGIDELSSGTIIATDFSSCQFYEMTRDWMIVETYGDCGAGSGTIAGAWSVAVDSRDNVYISDHNADKVMKFVKRSP